MRGVAIGLAIAGLMLVTSPVPAAIGIFNWYPVSQDPAADIHYRLNTDASSGQILIKDALTGTVVRTLILSGSQLVRGPHKVTWLGDADGGGSAPTADYVAEITVSAPPVVEDPQNRYKNRHDFAYVAGALAPFYGVAVDTNPANNDQTNPERSTYGLVYATDTANKRILAFYPDAWTDEIKSGEINAFRSFSSGTAGNASSPWGISVGADGRIYSTARSDTAVQGFHNYSPDGASQSFGGQKSTSQDTLAFGSAADGTALHLRSVGNAIERARVRPDYSYYDDLPADPLKIASTVLSGATSVFGFTAGPTPSETSPLWITNYSVTPSVSKWVWNGASYALDPGWAMTTDPLGPGSAAVGVDISPANPGRMAVGCERRSNNLVLLNAVDGSLIRAYSPSGVMVHNVKFDAVGNIVLDCGGDSRANKQRVVSVFFPEDNGSSDTRTTIAFSHTFGNIPPEVLSASADPAQIRENDLDTASLTVVVQDADGQDTIASVAADLSALGYESEAALTLDAVLGPATARYVLAGVRAKPTSRAGSALITVRVLDSAGGVGFGSAALTLTGGTVTGTVVHHVAGFPIAGAAVTLTDTVSGNVYSAVASSDAGAEGSFAVSANPGSYTVSAAKTGYGPGQPVEGVVVEQDATASGAQPSLGSVTVAEARNAPEGAMVCVEASVVAPPAASDWATGGQAGMLDDDGAGASFKYYLRDSSLQAGPIAGIKVDDGINKPERGDLVIVEGRKLYPNGYERNIQNVGHFHNRGAGQDPLAPEPVPLSSLTRLTYNGDYDGWGRYVQITEAVVVPGSRFETTATVGFRVTDPSTSEQWTVKVWKSLGVTFADLPRDNYKIPLKALVTRSGLFDQNCLEPARLSDMIAPPIMAETCGALRGTLDGVRIQLTRPHIVTLAEPGFFYVQDVQGTAGMRVNSAAPVSPGDEVQIAAEMGTTANGERVLEYASVSVTGTGSTAVRLMRHDTLGGPGYVNGHGLVTEGLLVRIYGRVTWADYLDNYFLLDDGSGVDSADVAPGVKVINTPYLLLPGQFCTVIGVVTPEMKDGKKIRVLRARQKVEDIAILDG